MSAPMFHVLTLDEVAEALRVSLRWVEERVYAGRIRSFLLDERLRRVAIEDLQEFIRSCREGREQPVEVPARREPMPEAPTPATPRLTLPVGLKPIESFEELARQQTGTSGRPSGSHSRQRRSRRSTSSTPERPSTSGAGSSTRSDT